MPAARQSAAARSNRLNCCSRPTPAGRSSPMQTFDESGKPATAACSRKAENSSERSIIGSPCPRATTAVAALLGRAPSPSWGSRRDRVRSAAAPAARSACTIEDPARSRGSRRRRSNRWPAISRGVAENRWIYLHRMGWTWHNGRFKPIQSISSICGVHLAGLVHCSPCFGELGILLLALARVPSVD